MPISTRRRAYGAPGVILVPLYALLLYVLLGAICGLIAAPFLIVLFAAELLATVLSLGSGSSGGIFSPLLFMGATLGAAFGAVCQHLIGVRRVL